jgi:phage terminase small subunit
MSHRTPTHLQVLRGNPSKRPIRPELEPLQTAEPPKPPRYLTRLAAAEWRRLAPELHRLGLLTVVDVAPLAAYCQAYARWRGRGGAG